MPVLGTDVTPVPSLGVAARVEGSAIRLLDGAIVSCGKKCAGTRVPVLEEGNVGVGV